MREEAAPPAHVRTPETDEVLRCIGRNVVTFQQVEYLLKYLNTHSAFSGSVSEFSASLEKHAATVQKKTMGELAGRLVDHVLRHPSNDEPPVKTDEARFGFRFSIESDAEFVDLHDREMRALVDARNDLIHHFLPRWQSAVGGDVDSALAYLDAQRDETLRMKERLESWARTVQAGKMHLAEFMDSPDGERLFEQEFLRGSRLVLMLGEIATRAPRADGWVVLSTAANAIKLEAPAELTDLRQRFGYATLKGVMLATELFDVTDEPTPGGGTRTIYRINERNEMQIRQDAPAVGTK